MFEVLRSKVENIPPRERERLARVARLAASRLDATHPPTAYRIQLLQARPAGQPEFMISAEDNEAIERELGKLVPEFESMLLDEYRLRAGR